jgi:acetylornithine aminotransferase
MMLDEIQTGMGRTGRLFAHQHQGITPDVMTLAKALGNGVPIGACLAAGRAVGLLGPGSHGSTFGGNPLACRAGIAVMETLGEQALPARAGELGERLLGHFRERLAALPGVARIRGRGLMIGIELDRPCAALVGDALAAGLLINVTAERVVRLLPPLTMTDEEAAQLVDGVSGCIETFLSAD